MARVARRSAGKTAKKSDAGPVRPRKTASQSVTFATACASPVISVAPSDRPADDSLVEMQIPRVAPLVHGPWTGIDVAVVGSSHLRNSPPKPCQDAAVADALGRGLVVLADGAGSAAVSHLGASAVVGAVRRLCRTKEDELAVILDAADQVDGSLRNLAQQIVRHAKGVVEDVASGHMRSQDDFRCTLLVWVVGKQRALWVKVGDGALVAEVDARAICIGPIGKGEFANQTNFVGPLLVDSQWSWGVIDSTRLTGVVAMSDGAAERLVSNDATSVSIAIGKVLRGAAENRIGRSEVFNLLAEAEFWRGTSGDDKSLALIARAANPQEPKQSE